MAEPIAYPATFHTDASDPVAQSAGREQYPFADTGFESHAEVIAALRDGPLIGFDIGSTAIVGPGGVEGRVWVRADGRTWSISCLDASLLALLVRLEAFRAADLLADALVRASIEAEQKVDAIHRWSGRVRPTEDGE